jgi:hypothetical protein
VRASDGAHAVMRLTDSGGTGAGGSSQGLKPARGRAA